MRHLPRPRSTIFRIVLAMSLLAWAALALGAPRMPVPMGVAHAKTNAVDVSVHCAGMPQAHAPSHLHSVPVGQGDCCHDGCHCLSACSAVLLVAFAAVGTAPDSGQLRMRAAADVATVSAAPPLRPPIA
jgi:hypothetical protein